MIEVAFNMQIDEKSQYRLTHRLIHGFELEEDGDIEGAIREFKAASRLGSNDAKSKLGTIFDDVIKPRQSKKAIYWYKKGVEAGDSGCAWNLAMHYCGLRNRRWYQYWLQVAADMGDPDAIEEQANGNWWKKRKTR